MCEVAPTVVDIYVRPKFAVGQMYKSEIGTG
jgi:hypothetical protein